MKIKIEIILSIDDAMVEDFKHNPTEMKDDVEEYFRETIIDTPYYIDSITVKEEES